MYSNIFYFLFCSGKVRQFSVKYSTSFFSWEARQCSVTDSTGY